jgi:RNA polymerase sigma-70 factor (ECF subfamily)
MTTLLEAARAGDERAFAELVVPHRRELTVHCYRMLASADDADDALQETLLAAWRSLATFEGRSSLRAWLYRIATNVCLRMAERRPARVLSFDAGPARDPLGDLGDPRADAGWLGPLVESADDPAELLSRRETIELAYIAALQHLPANQRAVLILRDVLDFSAAECAGLLDTSVGSVTSALQRARATVADRIPDRTQQVERARAEDRGVVDAFVAAFERGDVPALVALLSEDVRFTMPPLPAWFDGITDVGAFLEHRSLITPWRVTRRVEVNGQPGLVGMQQMDGEWRPGAVMVLSFRDERIDWIASFLDPRDFLRADR